MTQEDRKTKCDFCPDLAKHKTDGYSLCDKCDEEYSHHLTGAWESKHELTQYPKNKNNE